MRFLPSLCHHTTVYVCLLSVGRPSPERSGHGTGTLRPGCCWMGSGHSATMECALLKVPGQPEPSASRLEGLGSSRHSWRHDHRATELTARAAGVMRPARTPGRRASGTSSSHLCGLCACSLRVTSGKPCCFVAYTSASSARPGTSLITSPPPPPPSLVHRHQPLGADFLVFPRDPGGWAGVWSFVLQRHPLFSSNRHVMSTDCVQGRI